MHSSPVPLSPHSDKTVPLLIKTLKGEKTDSTPCWFMRQAGRYLPEYRALRKDKGSFLDLCFDPESATEVTLQPIRRFGMDAAILFSDILVIPHALGQQVRFVTGEGPKLPPLKTQQDIQALHYSPEALTPVIETVKHVRTSLGADKALIGFAGAPWTVACYMVEGGGSKDFTTIRRKAIQDPKWLSTLINTITESTILYLKAQIEAGANCLQLFDSWAGILPPEQFEQWVIAPATKIVSSIKADYPDIPIIGFPKGAGQLYPHYAEQTDVDALSLDFQVPLDWAADAFPKTFPLQGNLDPLLLLGDTTTLLKQADKIHQAMQDRPFIFNLGHGIVPDTPPEHVAALVEHIHSWKK